MTNNLVLAVFGCLLLLSSAPSADAASSHQNCEYMTLDFKNIPNPMAKRYGQSDIFQGGDYLYDQLWDSHGVKVSARVRSTSHRSGNNPFIPMYDEDAEAWINAKQNQNPNDPTTGGAVRLFDTMRPTYNTNKDFHQPLCSNERNEGDTDLGAPNEKCAVPGPGVGEGGWPTSKHPNCEPLGLVAIIQENNKSCPDDTGRGGFITFTFRDPVPIKLTSLLDIDDGKTTPKIHIYQQGKDKVTIVTEETGENGLYNLDDLDQEEYNEVTMIDVEYAGSGSINALQYRYCPEMPTPRIQILKFAGPPEKCSQSEWRALERDLYTVPSEEDEWVYCYRVRVHNKSEEDCLLDVSFTDPAPNGLKDYIVKEGTDPLCKEDGNIFIEGNRVLGSLAPEGPDDATVTGYGYMSGIRVTDADDAAVTVEIDIPANCIPPNGEWPKTGGDHCPGDTGVVVAHVAGATPSDADVDIIYNITEVNDGSAVQFQVQSPFPQTATKLYVEYNSPSGSDGAWSQECEKFDLGVCAGSTGGSFAELTPIVADCIQGDGEPAALVRLYFVEASASTDLFGSLDVPECCLAGDDTPPPNSVAQYVFMIRCACPSGIARA